MKGSTKDFTGGVFLGLIAFFAIKQATSSDILGFLAFVCVLAFINEDLRVAIEAVFKR
jgi:hypothetical protein